MFAGYAASVPASDLLKELLDPSVAATKHPGWASSGIRGLELYKLVQQAYDTMLDCHLGTVGASLLALSKKEEGAEKNQMAASIVFQIETLAAQPQRQQWATAVLNIISANGSKQVSTKFLPTQIDDNKLLQAAIKFMDDAKERNEWWADVCEKSGLGNEVVERFVSDGKSVLASSTSTAVKELMVALSKEVKAMTKLYEPCPDPVTGEFSFQSYMKKNGAKLSTQMKKVCCVSLMFSLASRWALLRLRTLCKRLTK